MGLTDGLEPGTKGGGPRNKGDAAPLGRILFIYISIYIYIHIYLYIYIYIYIYIYT